MLKVLNITEEGRFGGPQKRIFQVAVKLKKRHGIKTIPLFSKYNSERFQHALSDEGVSFHAIRLHRLTKDVRHLFGYLFYFIPEVYHIYSIIKKNKPDLVHCNGSWQVKGIIASHLAGVKNVWHMNDTYMPFYVHFLFKVVHKLFSSNRFIFASERTKQFYFPRGKSSKLKSQVLIPAPVDTSLFSPDKTFKSPFDDDFKGIRILTIGNVNPIKNHELFIRIAHAFQRMFLDVKVRFYVAGAVFANQQTYYQSLCSCIKKLGVNNLSFLGARSDIRELLNYTDIFVCSSEYEASPIAVWEALAMAKPCLSTDVGDVARIFGKYDCGLVGDKNDPTGMAKLLGKLVFDKDERSKMAMNARKAAIHEFDIAKCAEKHAAFYREVTGTFFETTNANLYA